MHCLNCDEKIMAETSWRTLFVPPRQQVLCDKCLDHLHLLSGDRCVRCSRETNQALCSDCQRFDNNREDPLTFNHSVYTYNEQMQDMISRWKYRGDYVLGNAFEDALKTAFRTAFPKSSHFEIVPIPLSERRLKERGFNQAAMLAQFVSTRPTHALTRIHGEKQSKKSRRERLSTINPFKLQIQLKKPVVLVDDIYTTGITIRHAADVLKQAGCPEIYSLTLIRG